MSTTTATAADIDTAAIFASASNAGEAINQLRAALDAGQCVERVETTTTIADNGRDYVAFLIDGNEVLRINGY